MSDRVNRFLGDTPGRVLIKLLVLSLIVGVVLSALNWTPYDIFWAVRDFLFRLWNMGFSAFGRFADYFLLGAAVVIPCYIIIRILKFGK